MRRARYQGLVYFSCHGGNLEIIVSFAVGWFGVMG